MVKRSTWIVVALLAIAIGAYFLVKNRPAASTTPTPTPAGSSFLINLGTDKLESIRVADKAGNITQVQRDPSGVWEVILPSLETADQASAEAAETQVGAMTIVTTLSTAPSLSDIGLDQPAYTIDITLASGVKHTIEVGNSTPTASGYYVRFDQKTILVVSQSSLDPLTAMAKNPPYVPTATPLPSDTPGPADTLQPPAGTPVATATP